MGLFDSLTTSPRTVARTKVAVTTETVGSAGMVVMMRKIVGVTPAGVLDKPFIFQVPPSSDFTISRPAGWDDYNTVGNKVRSRPDSNPLRQVSYDSLFLADTPWWTHLDPDPVNYSARRTRGAVPNPIKMLQTLEQLIEHHVVFRLTARNPQFWALADVNWWANIRELDSRETAGEPDSRYYSITFSEYRPTSVELRMIGSANSSGNGDDTKGWTVQVSSLTAGTTMYDLAKNYYGALTGWRLIAKANGFTIGPNAALSTLGGTTKVFIPRRVPATNTRKP